jgi:hypothetical protein
MFEYAMVGAEIGKYCGATALTFNMHNSSMAWSRFMFDMPNLTPEEKRRVSRRCASGSSAAPSRRRRSTRSRSPKAWPELDVETQPDAMPQGRRRLA